MFLYIIYASIILLASIPVLYFSVQKIIAEDVDEQLISQKNKFISRLSAEPLTPALIKSLQPHIFITKINSRRLRADSFYSINIFDSTAMEIEPFRILKSEFAMQENNYSLQISDSLVDAEDLKRSILKTVIIILMIMIGGLILINRQVSSNIWKPFYNSIKKLKQHKIETDEPLNFEKTRITEFAALNEALEMLSQRNAAVYQSQKEFSENASHEMQTPLSILQSKIDLLLQTSNVTPQQAAIIIDIENVNQRMKRLNKSLLVLTKIGNDQFEEKTEISITEILEKLASQYEDAVYQKKIIVTSNFLIEKKIFASKILIEIMLGNLFTNAIKHNIFAGTMSITAFREKILFCNTGKPRALEAAVIFNRFYKSSGDEGSIGLGLQIVKKIALINGFDIRYEFLNGQHCFAVHFIPG